MYDIVVPAMGESITEGTVARWAVRVGDAVKEGDLLLELETDKVNLEISAEQDGVLAEITRQEGDTVRIGEAVGRIGAAGSAAAENAGAAAGAVAMAIKGGSSAADAGAASVRPEGGAAASGQSAPPVRPGEAAAQEAVAPAAGPSARTQASPATSPIGVAASPAARKLAREMGIDLNRAATRDPLGRVYPADIRTAQSPAAADAGTVPSGAAVAASSPAGNPLPGKPEQRERMSRRRATIAKRLVAAQHEAAMLTTFNEVDMTAIMDLRKRRKQSFLEKHEVGLGFMSFFTKAVVGALKAFPLLNAQIDGEDIITKQYYDIGIAVAAKEGLVVPVVRDADRLSFAGIERAIANLAAKARDNKLDLADLQGGTFTITNGGVFGSLLSTPILNAPQVGILGMHKIQLRPVAIDQERMANRPMMYIALSYDHRIVDGAEAVQFLARIKEMLEDPETLLLES